MRRLTQNPDPYSPRTRRILSILCLLPALFFCTPSPYLVQKHAVYNFTDEGFLTPHLLQTIGRGSLAEDQDIMTARRLCLEEALHQAVRHALSVFMHTYFEIEAVQSKLSGSGVSFAADYPSTFTERDYIRAEIDFRPLLKEGFIALQDARSREECTVVFRIRQDDIPHRIRNMKVTFRPEKTPVSEKKDEKKAIEN